MTRRLTEELSEQERSVAEKRHLEDAVAVNGRVTEQLEQFSARVTELEGEAVKGEETVAYLNVKLKAADKRAEDVAYGRGDLQARLQPSQRGYDKVGESII